MGKQKAFNRDLKVPTNAHLPWATAWIPMATLILSGLLLLPQQLELDWQIVAPEVMFWVNFAAVWYFILCMCTSLGLWPFITFWVFVGFIIGFPVTLDLMQGGNVLRKVGHGLGVAMPQANASACLIGGIGIAGVMFVWDLLWSFMQTNGLFTASDFKVIKRGQTEETYELIGLKVTYTSSDKFEEAAGGYGDIEIASRTGKKIFEQKRVFGLFRIWWMPWKTPKKVIIDALISGTNINVTERTRQDIAEAMDSAGEDAFDDDDDGHDDEDDGHDLDGHSGGHDDGVDSSRQELA